MKKDGVDSKENHGKKKKRRFFSGLIHDFNKRFPYYW